jgi:hypothetical protein
MEEQICRNRWLAPQPMLASGLPGSVNPGTP